MPADPVRRFSSRVDAYAKYRPSYPSEILPFLAAESDLNAYTQVADIGSGTGILTKLFLDYGCEVTGVEPNAEMRREGDAALAGYERFKSVDGRAEATTLADHSYDLVVAGQAYHWFDADRARAEFARILRPPRWVALIWNERVVEGDPFLEGYEALLQRYGTDYKEVSRRKFFPHRHWKSAVFDNRQEFDFDGMMGRIDSSSYAPTPGTPVHTELREELRSLFEKTAREGKVAFLYKTSVYAGTLPPI